MSILVARGGVSGLHFLFSRRVAAREMKGVAVVLHKKRREVSQCVLLTKKSPNTILVIWVAVGKLYGFQLSKLRNQRLVNHQSLIAVSSWRLVFMLADALFQKLRHLEMWVAE